MSGQQRKDEILAKRAKLAELKRTREQRDKERAQRESGVHGALDVSKLAFCPAFLAQYPPLYPLPLRHSF